jgi:hypothetical protein
MDSADSGVRRERGGVAGHPHQLPNPHFIVNDPIPAVRHYHRFADEVRRLPTDKKITKPGTVSVASQATSMAPWQLCAV